VLSTISDHVSVLVYCRHLTSLVCHVKSSGSPEKPDFTHISISLVVVHSGEKLLACMMQLC
jgi:hypothetical protein